MAQRSILDKKLYKNILDGLIMNKGMEPGM